MKQSKAVSLLLSLSLLAGVAVPAALTLPVQAEEPSTDGGLVINKTADDNPDGTYTITLDAYATGEKIITEETKEVPTDIVLVLDQSGSMAWSMNTYSFRPYENRTNSQYYNLRHNGGSSNLYYKLDNGGYATVSVSRNVVTTTETYEECRNWRNYQYYSNSQNLYVKNADGTYGKVTVKRNGRGTFSSPYTYTYTFPDGNPVTSEGSYTKPDFQNHGPLYVRHVETDSEYTYTYTDQNGETQTIGPYQGADEQPDFSDLPDYTQHALYERYQSSSTSRLQALKTAVTNFTDSVAQKAAGEDGQLGTEDDVDHRIAVVGFASEGQYTNTELLSIEKQNSWGQTSIGQSYANADMEDYQDVLQDMNTTEGQRIVEEAIDELAASGATRADLGMNMAQNILNANPVQQNEERNRVVILFTDGAPNDNSGFDLAVANNAIDTANTIKSQNVTVYTVGIFEGADANSAGTKPNRDLGDDNNQMAAASNWFMQSVSSNNGTPQNPSYYLSAADAETLNNIFQQISDQIENGGASTTLNGDAVIKDVISQYFTLPEGTDASNITLKTYQYTGDDTWSENGQEADGVKATIEGDTVSVTGFDFAANWCGKEATGGETTYRGKKLEISFTVTPKKGFLGGNKVPTNASAGVYENKYAETPVATFPEPDVDVPIEAVTVTAPDKNVYLLQDVSADELKSLAEVTVGDIDLDFGKSDLGLESWQYDFVNIQMNIEAANGTAVTGFDDLTDDQTYTVSVSVTPKYKGESTGMSGEDDGTINVYKPELTFEDGEVWYGAAVPGTEELKDDCLVSTFWLHGEDMPTDEMATAPELSLTITPDQTKISDGKVNTKQDVPVNVSVSIGGVNVDNETTFKHENCSGQTCEVPDGYKFLLHPKTCQLTVTKTGGADGEPYVFTIRKDGESYSQVTVVGNNSVTIFELPVGSYTIEEDLGWSWRYESEISDGVDLSKNTPSGTITCNNSKTNDQWLNDFSAVVTNVFGSKK